MGTNYSDFLVEANRVIKKGGRLIIAEVLSRIENIKEFVKLMNRDIGFKTIKVS